MPIKKFKKTVNPAIIKKFMDNVKVKDVKKGREYVTIDYDYKENHDIYIKDKENIK